MQASDIDTFWRQVIFKLYFALVLTLAATGDPTHQMRLLDEHPAGAWLAHAALEYLTKANNFMYRYALTGLQIRALLYLGLAFALAHSATVRANEAAHVHGQGHVNIAIENDRIYMELESPGADIVGFEYAARSTAETEAVAKALAMLQDALQMLRFDAGASCSVVGASADIETEDTHDGHDGHDGHDHSEHEAGDTSSDHSQAGKAHGAYIAEYEISCANIDALKSIEFTYFEHFANAQSLNIVLIQGAQQRQLRVDRSNPVLTL